MMRSYGFHSLAVLLLATAPLGSARSVARGQDLQSTTSYVPDQVIVRVEHARFEELKLLEYMVGASSHERLFAQDLWLLNLPPGSDVRATAEILESLPFVTYATANAVVQVLGYPDDPSFGSQWGLDQSSDADIDAPEAWDLQTDASAIVVAVIDSGAQLDHPDLAANIWTNPGEIPGNGIDDEGNGYVDDVHGYDFYNRDSDPSDDHGHGTYCGGILGAVANNHRGVAGVCWKVQIMPLKFISAGGGGNIADAVRAVEYSMNNGARLSSNSWGGFSESDVAPLADAIHAAWLNKGMLFVAASGNDGHDNDVDPFYPASIPYPEVFAVGGSNQTDGLYGNWGRFSVDIAAPATNIYSTDLGSSYRWATGTSAAGPHVAGAVALAAAHCPDSDLLRIKTRIMESADKLPAFADKVVADGRLNLRRALEACPCQVTFASFGSGLAGSGAFVPELSGTDGGCAAGAHAMHLANVLGGTSGALWFGLGQSDVPFYGGHFYVDFANAWSLVTLTLQGQPGVPGGGFLDLPGTDMTAYSGLLIHLQGTFLDAGAPFGVSITNGLTMTID